MDVIKQNNVQPRLATIFMKYVFTSLLQYTAVTYPDSPETGMFVPFDIRLGSRGDSYYEYLL